MLPPIGSAERERPRRLTSGRAHHCCRCGPVPGPRRARAV